MELKQDINKLYDIIRDYGIEENTFKFNVSHFSDGPYGAYDITGVSLNFKDSRGFSHSFEKNYRGVDKKMKILMDTPPEKIQSMLIEDKLKKELEEELEKPFFKPITDVLKDIGNAVSNLIPATKDTNKGFTSFTPEMETALKIGAIGLSISSGMIG